MKRSHLVVLCVCLAIGVSIVGLVGWRLYQSDFWRVADVRFGDQHLKTTVALVELHKLRFGRYPATLDDLKYLGEWDPIALQSVHYVANPAGTRYCIEVMRGWVAKPQLELPAGFWQNTGYDTSLCRQR